MRPHHFILPLLVLVLFVALLPSGHAYCWEPVDKTDEEGNEEGGLGVMHEPFCLSKGPATRRAYAIPPSPRQPSTLYRLTERAKALVRMEWSQALGWYRNPLYADECPTTFTCTRRRTPPTPPSRRTWQQRFRDLTVRVQEGTTHVVPDAASVRRAADEWLAWVKRGLDAAVRTVLDLLEEILMLVWEWVLKPPFRWAFAAVRGVGDLVLWGLAAVVEGVAFLVRECVLLVVTLLSVVWRLVLLVLDAGFNLVWGAVTTLGNFVVLVLRGAWEAAVERSVALLGWVWDGATAVVLDVQDAWAATKAWAWDARVAVTTGVHSTVTGTTDAVVGQWRAMVQACVETWQQFVGTWVAAGHAIHHGFIQGVQYVLQTIRKAEEGIYSMARELKDTLWEWVSPFGGGVLVLLLAVLRLFFYPSAPVGATVLALWAGRLAWRRASAYIRQCMAARRQRQEEAQQVADEAMAPPPFFRHPPPAPSGAAAPPTPPPPAAEALPQKEGEEMGRIVVPPSSPGPGRGGGAAEGVVRRTGQFVARRTITLTTVRTEDQRGDDAWSTTESEVKDDDEFYEAVATQQTVAATPPALPSPARRLQQPAALASLPSSGGHAPPPSVPLLPHATPFLCAVLGKEHPESERLRAAVGTAAWDAFLALYRQDLEKRHLDADEIEAHLTPRPDGGYDVLEDDLYFLLHPPPVGASLVHRDAFHRLHAALDKVQQ